MLHKCAVRLARVSIPQSAVLSLAIAMGTSRSARWMQDCLMCMI